jgi:crossover junction endodeoxyribonuclease RuvC
MTHNLWHHYQYVVGVDPGFGCTGLAILDVGGIGVARWYRGDEGETDGERMSRLSMRVLCKAFAMTEVGKNRVLFAIEDNHFTGGRSAQTALKQRELIGVLKAEAWRYGFQVVSVAASSAKKAMTGSGNADKDAVRAAAREVDGYPIGLPKYADEAVSDAVAVAMAGIEKAKKELL